jgi:beta-glucosidase
MRASASRFRVVLGGASAAVVLVCSLSLGVAGTYAAVTPDQRAAALVARMTAAEKFALVGSGKTGVPRLGIPPVAFIDGPNGVSEGSKGVTAFPDAVNIGAAWDPALARAYGAALGAEAHAKGDTLIAAPTLNIVRTPLWGRAAETYGEDPFLTSSLVAPEIQGVQSARVMAQAKHFAGNNQDIGRLGIPLVAAGVDDRVSMRTLREIYFPGFKAAVQRGGAASVMCSYNRINGTQSCQNPLTLGILKGWGLLGFVEPDASLAVRDLVAAANAGVDQFQLGGLGVSVAALQSAVADGKVSQARVDDAARRILVGMIRVGLLGAGAPTVKPVASTVAHRALATKISAEATVLLQNRRSGGAPVLPLSAGDHSIAVIGYDAGKGTQIEEGGSPAVLPGGPVITPLAGIRARAPRGTKVDYALGTRGVVPLPIVPASVLTPASGSGHGLSATFYKSTVPTISGRVVGARTDPTIDSTSVLATGAGSARWTGTLTPPKTGEYRFSLTVAGNAKLFIDGRQIVTGDAEWINLGGSGARGAGFPGAPDQSFQGVVRLRANQNARITVEYAADASFTGTGLHLGWQPPEPSLLANAVAAARHAKVAIVFANDVTGEGMDRPSLSLPGDQNQLIAAVARANPRTVVVLHTASAVLMPWRNRVAGIVEAWYPGQQSGAAIAKTLFGDVDPSGRLPVTFPASGSQGPTARTDRYPGVGNVAQYSEGIFVGYRYYDRFHQAPLFPFGYGLAYTSFSLDQLKVIARRGGAYAASVSVRNTGRRAGAEVVEAYLSFPSAAGEPPRQLKAFAKVFLVPGGTRAVRLDLPRSSFEYYSSQRGSWTVQPGRYSLSVGTSSRDLPLGRQITVR